MGSERYDEDSNERSQSPKLTLVGHIEGSLNGRPLAIRSTGNELRIVTGVLTALKLLRYRNGAKPIVCALKQHHVSVFLHPGWLGAWRLN